MSIFSKATISQIVTDCAMKHREKLEFLERLGLATRQEQEELLRLERQEESFRRQCQEVKP